MNLILQALHLQTLQPPFILPTFIIPLIQVLINKPFLLSPFLFLFAAKEFLASDSKHLFSLSHPCSYNNMGDLQLKEESPKYQDLSYWYHSNSSRSLGSSCSSRSDSWFGKLWRRSASQQHLIMDTVGSASPEEGVPLPSYERLSQSARSPQDPDPRQALQVKKQMHDKHDHHHHQQQQKPVAWKLIDLVRSGKGDGHEGDSKQEEEKGKKEEKKKKRSSWLPDPEHRWPVQGW